MTPLISIVMPVYNAERYLHESVKSVLEQTFRDFEFIIVDDGSMDNSVDIVRQYKDERIRLIFNQHNYIDSLNRGMNNARGKYIARMDADDKMVPERLQIQWEFMEKNAQIDVCGGWMETFGFQKMQLKHPVTSEKILLSNILGCSVFHPTAIMKRSVIEKMPCHNGRYVCYHPDYIYAEDYKFWIDLIIKGCVFANIPQVLLHYRISESQVTHVYKKEMLACTIKIQSEYMQYVMEQICSDKPVLEPLMINLIELYNEDKISFFTLRKAVHLFYEDILLKY